MSHNIFTSKYFIFCIHVIILFSLNMRLRRTSHVSLLLRLTTVTAFTAMLRSVLWFRNDLRFHDQPLFHHRAVHETRCFAPTVPTRKCWRGGSGDAVAQCCSDFSVAVLLDPLVGANLDPLPLAQGISAQTAWPIVSHCRVCSRLGWGKSLKDFFLFGSAVR